MKLNAPASYRWTDEEVVFEKLQSRSDGIMIGLALGTAIAIFALILGAVLS